MSNHMVLQGDCLELLKDIPDNSLDSMITDPPAGISFMNKAWDDDKGGRKQWISWMESVMRECLRVLKPGAHGLVWAIPRTSHWTATALEDAGFEIRDVVTHLFGTGFPKSLNIGKAINKSDSESSKWQGWGTALKPASEHWILVRKPCSEKTVASNVLLHGTGGINIDASRINLKPGEVPHGSGANQGNTVYGDYATKRTGVPNITSIQGRFPANLVLSHNEDCEDQCSPGCAVQTLDDQSGILKSGAFKQTGLSSNSTQPNGWKTGNRIEKDFGPANSGGASRFFYCAKASQKDKNAGLEGMPKKQIDIGDERPSGSSAERRNRAPSLPRENIHPTVKSTELMSYLIKLITPPNGFVLDPFTGSGSTGVAAIKGGFGFLGIEQQEEYVEIAKKRIDNAA